MKPTKIIMLLVLCLGVSTGSASMADTDSTFSPETATKEIEELQENVKNLQEETKGLQTRVENLEQTKGKISDETTNSADGAVTTESTESGAKTEDESDVNKTATNMEELNKSIAALQEKTKELDGKIKVMQDERENFVADVALGLSILSLILTVGPRLRKSKKKKNPVQKNVQSRKISEDEAAVRAPKRRLYEFEGIGKSPREEQDDIRASLQRDDSYRWEEDNNNNEAESFHNIIKPAPRPVRVEPVPDPVMTLEPVVNETEPLSTTGQYLDQHGRDIMAAYQEMMAEISRVSTYEGDKVRDLFAEQYQVHAFKCVNAGERVTNRALLPKFAESIEGTLWGILLQNGTLAVFPNLTEYESSIHLEGGMKELFNSKYNGGNYSQIEVKTPAIVVYDSQTKTFDSSAVKQKGELLLSKQ